MQVNYNQIDDHCAVQLLLKEMVDRNEIVRHQLIIDQIKEAIIIKWIDYVHKNRLEKKPTKCVARFHLVEGGFPVQNSAFTLSTQVESPAFDFEDCVKHINTAMRVFTNALAVRDLDRVEFEPENAIEIYEYHDITKGF